MDKKTAEEDLGITREVMERASHYIHFSGISGVLSGILGLAGCAATYWIDGHLPSRAHDVWYMAVWSTVLILAIVEDLFLAQRKARAKGETIWNPATCQVIKAMLPGVLIAIVWSYTALHSDFRNVISAIWALGYGAALCATGMFSIKEVWRYGILQLITGTIGILFLSNWHYSFYLAGLSFGVYQILFGLLIAKMTATCDL